MSSPQNVPTERSPLLSARDEITPEDATRASAVSDATLSQTDDVERHNAVDVDRAAQYKGNTDVQKQLKYIVPALSIGIFLVAGDSTIVVASYGRIGNELEALNLTSWIATAYFLSLTSFQPLYGKLSDIFGRKGCLLVAYIFFGIGTLLCGLSQNMYHLIIARVIQGIGGGGMSVVVSVLFSDIVPLEDRGVWQGILNIIYSVGSAGGAGIGGLLADTIGWRWTFLAQTPLCLVATITVYFALNLPATGEQKWRAKLRRVDFLGAIILVVAVFGLVFGVDRGSNVSWSTPLSYAPLAVSTVSFAAFVYVETKVAPEPLAPGHVMFEKSMFACFLCYFFAFGSWLSVLYYVPLFFQAVDGLTASGAALRLMPAIFGSVSGSLFGGFVMKRLGKFYWLTVGAYSALVIGVTLMLLFLGLVVNSTTGVAVSMAMSAFGNGIGMTTCLIALIANAAPKDQAVATAGTYLFRSLGSIIGISLSATIIQQVLRRDLRQYLGSGNEARTIEENVRRSLEYITSLDPETQETVRRAYADAIRHGMVFMLVVAFGALFASIFIREKKLK